MLYINKITSNHTVDYAAEELKKYLRMMMPECGDVVIAYNPLAADGFRLGLMQDFGLDVSDAPDVDLDDILYIDCDTKGGIIAGDNPRSVLLSVYEYFRQNGCRWLKPGVDGEYVPMQDVVPVKYRYRPLIRYRGFCNEGAEFQRCMIDAIEFAPKVGINAFMLEFFIPKIYYDMYYKHGFNEESRNPEPVSLNQVLRWKRQCECEIAKRGLQFHDIGHGFNCYPFGINPNWRFDDPEDHNLELTPEQKSMLAMINGERVLNRNCSGYTNFCMSNPEAQRLFAKFVADYAENHSNEDFLHIGLADGNNRHCECDECRKMRPSDWFVQILNKSDEELTRRGLKTRLVFAMYVDLAWAPEFEKIKNPDRFTIEFCPITRDYTETLPAVKSEGDLTTPYVRNQLIMPKTLEEFLAYRDQWIKSGWTGPWYAYEYHFWRHQYHDISGIELSKRIVEDIKTYFDQGFSGIIEDGSQRSFFPTGLAFYTYARCMYDPTLTAREIAEDYFKTAFGEDWEQFYDYLVELENAMKYRFSEGKMSKNEEISKFYNPEEAELLATVPSIVAKGRELIKAHYNSDERIITASVRMLEHHADFAEMHAKALRAKALGNDEEATKYYHELRVDFGRREPEIQEYFDHYICFKYLENDIFKAKSNVPTIVI